MAKGCFFLRFSFNGASDDRWCDHHRLVKAVAEAVDPTATVALAGTGVPADPTAIAEAAGMADPTAVVVLVVVAWAVVDPTATAGMAALADPTAAVVA
jgi:hypothetical protein